MIHGIMERRKKVRLEIKAEPGSEVFVAGTFNNWNPSETKLRLSAHDGWYQTTLHLPRGTHQYKFVVNGVWMADPANSQCAANDFGSANSVVEV